LTLLGLRSHTYSFTVLALRSLSIVFEPSLQEQYPAYEIGRRLYSARVLPPQHLQNLSLKVRFGLDGARIKMVPSKMLCRPKLGECTQEEVLAAVDSSFNVEVTSTISSNLTLKLLLLPMDPGDSSSSSTYTIRLTVDTLLDRLEELALEMSKLRGEVDSLQEFDPPQSAETLKRLREITQQRDDLLREAYKEQASVDRDVGSNRKVTFLAVGMTGTGKSELCRWMTGNQALCTPSSSTKSHTSEVIVVDGMPFNDPKLLSNIEWLDTPGRGDTRGYSKDSELWNQTVYQLRNRESRNINAIVWVLNGAWQRGTAGRKLMLRELRRTFGMELYRHLCVVLNFLPHPANKSLYEEELSFQEKKFMDWILETEMEMFNWSARLFGDVESEVRGLRIYGLNIHPKYYSQKPTGLPLSAPYLSSFPPFSHPVGVASLVNLFKDAQGETAKHGYKALDPGNLHPRIGPGLLLSGNYSKTCKPVPSEQTAHVYIVGMELSSEDRAVLVPESAECGDPDAKLWPLSWPKQVRAPSNLSESFTSAVFDLALPTDFKGKNQKQKLCFCEAPKCNESWRFGQRLNISIVGCSSSPITKASVNLGAIIGKAAKGAMQDQAESVDQ